MGPVEIELRRAEGLQNQHNVHNESGGLCRIVVAVVFSWDEDFSVAFRKDVDQRNLIPFSGTLAENLILPPKVQHACCNRFQDAGNLDGALTKGVSTEGLGD